MADYFKFASENARREFAQPEERLGYEFDIKQGQRRLRESQAARGIILCTCQVVTGGHLALNHACPLHGDPAYREYLTSDLDTRD